MKQSHGICPKCGKNIVRFNAGKRELCGICDPKHETKHLGEKKLI
jgi:NMD protein affecting ribosome stability and mRNA decay